MLLLKQRDERGLSQDRIGVTEADPVRPRLLCGRPGTLRMWPDGFLHFLVGELRPVNSPPGPVTAQHVEYENNAKNQLRAHGVHRMIGKPWYKIRNLLR